MLKRKINKELCDFMKNEARALLVTGARQVGKTFSIRQAANECFEHVIEINFIEQPDAVKMFEGAQDAKELILRISSFTHEQMLPGKTLIFFDEVQECKEIVTAIKFLVDEGSYRYVMSGSLLGVELKDIRSVPVGYMSEKEMYPLDLEEFAEAISLNRDVLDHLGQCYDKQKPVDDFVHSQMMRIVWLYLVVGGMPAVVQKYLETNDVQQVLSVQRDIIKTYKRDIAKYDLLRKLQIEEIYDLIPSELNAKNKRFILKELNEKARFGRYESGVLWLKDAGVALPTYNIEEPRLPLLLNKQRNLFKLYLNDVGLLAAAYGGNIQMRLLTKDNDINFGAIYENLVAQELYAHGLTINHDLFYFNSKKQGELDFVIEFNGDVLPIEVKSGKEYNRHRALANVMDSREYNIPHAVVLSQENVQIAGKVLYLPIYMTMFLQKRVSDKPLIYKLDMTGLK